MTLDLSNTGKLPLTEEIIIETWNSWRGNWLPEYGDVFRAPPVHRPPQFARQYQLPDIQPVSVVTFQRELGELGDRMVWRYTGHYEKTTIEIAIVDVKTSAIVMEYK